MIRDRLIVGIFDKHIQARLLRENELDVNKIMEYCKSIMLSKEHLRTLNSSDIKQESVDAVKSVKSFDNIKCSRCLYEHSRNQCPAFRKTCARCQKLGHFAKACRSNWTGDSSRAIMDH